LIQATRRTADAAGVIRASKSILAAVLTVSALGATPLVPSAAAAGDPVSSGQFNLSVSPGFKARLKAKHVRMRVRGLAIESGSVNPLTGHATLKLSGSLQFKHGKQKVSFQKLSATIGPNGSLTGSAKRRGRLAAKPTTIFWLNGGSVARDGFGANVTGVRASFAGAKSLGRSFGVKLPGGNVAWLDVQTQPETVEVLGGSATVNQNFSSDLVAKLRAHCIDPVAGVTPSGAATGGSGNPIQIPVSGGTISPTGWTAGVVTLAGGLDIQVGGAGLPSGCPTSSVAIVHVSNLAVNVAHKSILTDFSVESPYSPFGDAVMKLEMQGDVSNATMTADPANHRLDANGAALGLDSTSAMIMNQYLPHASGSVPDFAVGDVLGTAAMTVHTR
jgi:hypothetical protein